MGGEATLTRDHRALDALLAEGAAALEAGDAARAHRSLDRLWMRLAIHIRAEHKVLFPAVLAARPDLGATLAVLRTDHDAFMEGLAKLLPRLRTGSPDISALRQELQGIQERLDDHNRLEESRIYPAAPESAALEAALGAELAFLPSRYEA